MARRAVEAIEYTCDACKKAETRSDPNMGDVPPGWFEGTAEHQFAAASWLACRKSCIVKAVEVALTKGDDE